MTVLTFDAQPVERHGTLVKPARFVRRSALPLSAACLIANSMRERLAVAFGTDVFLRLLEPQVPDASAWAEIERDAFIYPVTGTPCAAAFVLQRRDALAVAGGVFGESTSDTRKLSELERGVLDRAIDALVHTLVPLCGAQVARRNRRTEGIRGYSSYFEVLVERPVVARIGVAISPDPHASKGRCLQPRDLFDLRLPLRIELGSCSLDAARFLDLCPGDRIRLETRATQAAKLTLNGRLVALGDAGEYRGMAAFLVRGGRREIA